MARFNVRDDVSDRAAPILRRAQDEDFGRAAAKSALTLSSSKGEDKVPSLGDLRFRALLRAEDWAALPEPVRARFSKRLTGGDSVVYTGAVTRTRFSSAARALAAAAVVSRTNSPRSLSSDSSPPSPRAKAK